MLAQLNSKQKSIFLNIKPTVIDKLISKNKCSIQNSLLYTNDDSDVSLSEDSEESSSSSQEGSPLLFGQHTAIMPPIRRSEKVAGVLGSKLSSRSQFPLKKGPAKSAGNAKGGKGNLKVIAAKKVLENTKRDSPRKIGKEKLVSSVSKVKKNHSDSESLKSPRSSLKKENLPSSTAGVHSIGSVKSSVNRKKTKVLQDTKHLNTNVNKNQHKNQQPNSQSSTASSINTKTSPRKFPSNIVGWKSTGLVIRGRGRPRGSRGSLRGGIKIGPLRSERYNTRDSQTGLMRSGKRRKCSDPNLVEGLEGIKKRRKVINSIKREKSECFSDDHSSFVTSELSFYENDNSMKQSDDENSKLVQVKLEIEDTEYENTHSTDTNSNVFKSNRRIKKELKTPSSGSDTNDQSNNSINLKQNSVSLGLRKFDQNNKRLVTLDKKVVSKSDSSIRDSDCSFDSDFTEDPTNSPKSGGKRHRKKGVDGLWVRRSTRSVGKNIDKTETDSVVIEELLKERDFIVDIDSNSKSSLNIDGMTNCDSSVDLFDVTNSIENKSPKQNDSSLAVIETPIIINKNNVCSFLSGEGLSDNKITSFVAPVKDELKPNIELSSDKSIVSENNSLVDFTLSFEESPVKQAAGLRPESKTGMTSKLHLDALANDEDVVLLNNFNALNSTVSVNDDKQTNSIKVIKDVEEENASIKCESNNVCDKEGNMEKTDSNEQNTCSDKLDKNKMSSIVDPKDKGGATDILVDHTEEKLNDQVCKDKELISDENILSLIDTLCQSDSTVSEEGLQASTVTDINDDKQIILDSVNAITAQVESKLLEENLINELSSTTNSPTCRLIRADNDEKVSLRETATSLPKEIIKQEPDCETFRTEIETKNEKTESVNNVLNVGSSNICTNFERTSCFENNMNMELDLDCMVKAPESTEEFSSDSNSNLSELTTVPLEHDSVGGTLRDDSIMDCQGSSVESLEIGKVNDTHSSRILNENDSCYSQSCNFSSLESTDSNKTSDMNKEAACTQNSLVRNIKSEGGKEERPSKELLSALGLQSLHSIAEEKPKRPSDSYTGTLKAVIKLNRSSDKRSGGRKMIFKQGEKMSEDPGGCGDRLEYRICSAEELSTECVPLTHLADIPANRKGQIKVKSQFDLSNSPNIVGTAGSVETNSDSTKEAGGKQNLIIPEKSSSFSIHPERLCTDVCSYCFGKFGSLDTPCHLAQLKNSERQAKILAIEVHLSADSCLCDGCFRYVDRKANCPASQRSRKPAARRGPLAGTICAVQECAQPARHSVRRKWLIKLKKSIGKKLVIDMDKNPHLPFPLCSQHYYWVDYFTVCGICKKRLTRNHMYALGPEAEQLNKALSDDGIPVRLSDKLFLCKLCRYYSSLRMKYHDSAAMSSTHRLFLNSYRKKILTYHDIPVSDSEDEGKSLEEECGTSEVSKSKKKKSKSKSLDGHEPKKRNIDKEDKSDPGNEDRSNDSQMIDYSYLDTLNVHREEPTTPTVDYSTLGDFEGQVGFSNIASFLNPLEGGQGTVYPGDSQNRSRTEKPTRIQVKFGNLNIGKLSNLNIGQDTRPPSATTPALERPPFLPGERDLKLSGEFEFHGSLSPSSSWERCTSTIQFDRDTKKLWQELQRPYGNQSSFLRHLVILEKHWRNGSLILSENPNPKAVKYLSSVRNRVQAYDGAKSFNVTEQPKQPEVNVKSQPPRPMSTPLKTMTTPPPLMKITPGSAPWLQEQLKKPPPYSYTATSTHSVSTNSRLVPVTAPPPYRFPVSKPNQVGPRAVRLPVPSSSYRLSGRGQNVRPMSISYQQFKKIRLEKPPSVQPSQVTLIPKMEPVVEAPPSTSNSSDFVPLICDVRSLASTANDWNESFRLQQQKLLKQNVAKYYTPILPKIPNSLTVTTYPQTTGFVMKTTSLTIEKAPNTSTKPNIAPPEKPSISVFRETTPSENS